MFALGLPSWIGTTVDRSSPQNLGTIFKLCVGDLALALAMSDATISHRLKTLRALKLVGYRITLSYQEPLLKCCERI